MKRTVLTVAAALLLAGLSLAKEIRMTSSENAPAAYGRVHVQHDRNQNVKMKIEVFHLADPAKLSPAKNIYVVWIQPKGKPAENEGQLRVNEDLKGTFESNTPYEDFDVFVTAEDNAHAETPSSERILSATVQK